MHEDVKKKNWNNYEKLFMESFRKNMNDAWRCEEKIK